MVGGRLGSRAGVFDDALAESRGALRSSLAVASADRAGVERLTGLRGPLLERAGDSFARLVAGDAPLLATWRRYNGVVWVHLDPATLNRAQRRRILVPSALYGVTAGDDPIADYRLTFHASVPGVGPLGAFWREPVTRALLAVVGRYPVVDLLPTEHRRAVDVERIAEMTRVITVRFQSADGTRAIGHAAKAVKGVLARRLLEEGISALQSFAWGPWRGAMLDDSTATITSCSTEALPSL